MDILDCQDVLVDKSASGRVRPWALYKLNSGYVALAYDEVDSCKAQRMRDCANYLGFKRGDDGNMRLHDARFCRVRLCPICQWRRSLKTFGQMTKILQCAEQDYSFVFLTLTVKNCAPDKLDKTLTDILQGYNRMTKYKAFATAVKGYYRGCEVTHNITNNTYHPHLHCILAVNKSYFTSKNYLSHDAWVAMWQKACKLDYEPKVNIKKCKGGYKAVAEACKYAVKPDEIINPNDWDMTVDTVRVLDTALAKRRFIGLGGIFKDLHKQLNLDDIEDGDLLNRQDEQAEPTTSEIYYFWNGYNQYKKG